jgi:hypothetical protein
MSSITEPESMRSATSTKMPDLPGNQADDELVQALQTMAFSFFTCKTNLQNGLVHDSTEPGTPCSISAVGFGLSCLPVAIERGLIKRADALAHTLAALQFFYGADQSGKVDGVGYKGFFYHFLDMHTGRRAWQSELSTIDTTFLLAGMLVAAQYFNGNDAIEREICRLTNAIYARIDWRWAQNDHKALALSWKPESGFNKHYWLGYNEAMLIYVLALAAPVFSLNVDAYRAWTSTFRWKRIYGHDVLYARPLFIHQYSHIWLDLRGIQDGIMTKRHSDYFKNSRKATYIQQQYAISNPRQLKAYNEFCWGFTASNGPGKKILKIDGREYKFFGYIARGVPFGPDDGTISPWTVIAALPFAPEIVIPTVRYLKKLLGYHPNGMGFLTSFNPSYPGDRTEIGWVSPWHYAINQGAVVLMIENYRTGLIWSLMRDCAAIRLGLRRCGFEGGWLDDTSKYPTTTAQKMSRNSEQHNQ